MLPEFVKDANNGELFRKEEFVFLTRQEDDDSLVELYRHTATGRVFNWDGVYMWQFD